MEVQKKVNASLANFKRLTSLKPERRTWIVGFSGGKDSTAVLCLIYRFLESVKNERKLPKRIIIVYTDTLVEIPAMKEHALNVLRTFKEICDDIFANLVSIRILRPKVGEDFFSMMIEKGYSAPHYRYRWCMDRLKLKPLRRFLSMFNVKDSIIISGIRFDESLKRRSLMEKRHQTSFLTEYKGRLLAAPLINWTTDDIWSFVLSKDCPLRDNLRTFFDLYGGLESNKLNLRFGCWVCTVVRRDRALSFLSLRDYRYKVLLRFKEKLRSMSTNGELRELRTKGRWKYGKLNKRGRLRVISMLHELLVNEHGFGLEAYTSHEVFYLKLRSWIHNLLKESPSMHNILY